MSFYLVSVIEGLKDHAFVRVCYGCCETVTSLLYQTSLGFSLFPSLVYLYIQISIHLYRLYCIVLFDSTNIRVSSVHFFGLCFSFCFSLHSDCEIERGLFERLRVFLQFASFFLILAEWKNFIKKRVEKQHQHLPKLHPNDSEELSLGQRNQKCYSANTSGPIFRQPCQQLLGPNQKRQVYYNYSLLNF